MLCPSCGRNIDGDSRYCTYCAERLPDKEAQISDIPASLHLASSGSIPSATDTADRVSAKVAWKAIYIVGGFLAIVIIAFMKAKLALKLVLLALLVPFLYLLHLFVRGGTFFLAWLFTKVRGR